MKTEDKIEVLSQREYLVVKGNELIQQNRFELSLPEQKTVAYICSMIKPLSPGQLQKGVPYQLEYEFNIREYCKACGIDYAGGKNYKDIKATLKKLSDRSMWLETEDAEILMRWLSYVKVNKKSEKVTIEVDRTIAPYLFCLQEKFTQYQLYNILAMKSAFSVRIYELMKSYAFQKTKTFDIDELKHLLMVDDVKSYSNYADFKKRVLDKAQEEINALTDINIYFEPVTKGRKVIKVKFRIEQKSTIEMAISNAKVNELLEYDIEGQMEISDYPEFNRK